MLRSHVDHMCVMSPHRDSPRENLMLNSRNFRWWHLWSEKKVSKRRDEAVGQLRSGYNGSCNHEGTNASLLPRLTLQGICVWIPPRLTKQSTQEFGLFFLQVFTLCRMNWGTVETQKFYASLLICVKVAPVQHQWKSRLLKTLSPRTGWRTRNSPRCTDQSTLGQERGQKNS